jgi:hypothetical protein
MDVEVKYASLLDGKLLFGDPYNIPEYVDIVVNTLSDYDKKYTFEVDEKKVRRFPMRPGFEPEYLNLFEVLMGDLDSALVQGKSIYILDPDGTERSALLAWRLLVRNTRSQKQLILNLVNEAYQKRTNKLVKLESVEVPRFSRQMSFGQILPCGGYERYSKKRLIRNKYYNMTNAPSNKNRRQRVKGKVRTNLLLPNTESNQYCDPFILDHMSVRLVQVANGVWHGLSAQHLGPIDLSFVSMYGIKTVERSYTLYNAFFSLWVFEEHLNKPEENHTILSEKPNTDFFLLHSQMVGSLKPMKKHPLYERRTPYHKGHLPKYLYWQGELIPFKYGKVYIYSALYRLLVKKTRVFRDLENTIESGANVLLIDYDAVDFTELGMTYEEFIDDEEQPWTDAHILYGILHNHTPWLIEDILEGVVF